MRSTGMILSFWLLWYIFLFAQSTMVYCLLKCVYQVTVFGIFLSRFNLAIWVYGKYGIWSYRLTSLKICFDGEEFLLLISAKCFCFCLYSLQVAHANHWPFAIAVTICCRFLCDNRIKWKIGKLPAKGNKQYIWDAWECWDKLTSEAQGTGITFLPRSHLI